MISCRVSIYAHNTLNQRHLYVALCYINRRILEPLDGVSVEQKLQA